MMTGQIEIIPKSELRQLWGDSVTKPAFGVTNKGGIGCWNLAGPL